MEDQVTYPIVTACSARRKVKAVRGFSDFGYSYVYIIFEDGTDIYWARSRTLEYLSGVLPRLPAGREDRTRAGCDRRRLGLPVRAGGYDRQAQSGRTALAPGLVSALSPEVRAGRGRGRAARRLRPAVPGQRRSATACRLTTSRSARWSRRCAAATTTSAAAWSSSAAPSTWCAAAATRSSVRRHRATSSLSASAERRRRFASRTSARSCSVPTCAAASPIWNGKGDVVSGIVVMRQGENALDVIERVKAKLHEIEPGLPDGRQDRHRLRPLRADPPLDRQPEGHAHRGDGHRRRSSS